MSETEKLVRGDPHPLGVPLHLWLQWHGDGTPEDDGDVRESEVSWCREKIFDTDIRYVLAPVHECKWKTFRRPGTYDDVWGSWDAVQECECGKRRFGKSDEHGNFLQNVPSVPPERSAPDA